MKKALYVLFLLAALGCIIWFVGIPAAREYLSLESRAMTTPLLDATMAHESLAEYEWKREEIIRYTPRPIPDLEADFLGLGYPAFLFLDDGYGQVDRTGEKAVHEDGMVVYLYMEDGTGYLTSSLLEYSVPQERFSSTAMDQNIQAFLDYASVITGRSIDENTKKELLRAFTELFNDPDKVPRTAMINGLEFTISVDPVMSTIIMELPEP